MSWAYGYTYTDCNKDTMTAAERDLLKFAHDQLDAGSKASSTASCKASNAERSTPIKLLRLENINALFIQAVSSGHKSYLCYSSSLVV